MATLGPLEGDLTLKFHHFEVHSHRADVSQNIVSATLHEFRDEVKTNPDRLIGRSNNYLKKFQQKLSIQ